MNWLENYDNCNERYPALRVVMMGGEGLAALKYASGSLSLLNIAEELPIPQLTHRDLHDLFGQQYRQLNLSPAATPKRAGIYRLPSPSVAVLPATGGGFRAGM